MPHHYGSSPHATLRTAKDQDLPLGLLRLREYLREEGYTTAEPQPRGRRSYRRQSDGSSIGDYLYGAGEFGLVQEAARSAARFVPNLASEAGGLLQLASDHGIVRGARELGEDIEAFGHGWAGSMPASTSFQEKSAEEQLRTDPLRVLAAKGPESTLPFLVPAGSARFLAWRAGVAARQGMAAHATKLARASTAVERSVLPSIAARVAGMEYPRALRRNLARGDDEDSARTAATVEALANAGGEAALEMVPLRLFMGRAVPGLGKAFDTAVENKLLRVSRGAAVLAGVEGLEEVLAEGWTSTTAHLIGRDPHAFDEFFWRAAQAGLIGGVTGGALGAVSAGMGDAISQGDIPRLIDEARAVGNQEIVKDRPPIDIPPQKPEAPEPQAPVAETPAAKGGEKPATPEPEPEPPPAPTWQTRAMNAVRSPTGISLYFPGGQRRVRGRWAITDANQVVASNDPVSFARSDPDLYPSEIQGRAYDGPVGEQARNDTIVKAQTPDIAGLLGLGSEVDYGAPTVTNSGVVVAGNARTMILQRMWQDAPDQAANYKTELMARAASFGLDPGAVAAYDNPVLVRQLDDVDYDFTDIQVLKELNTESDTPGAKSKGIEEEGATRAAALVAPGGTALPLLTAGTAEGMTVNAFLDTAGGRDFIKALLKDGVIFQSETARYVKATGEPTKAGKQLIEASLKAAALADPEGVPDVADRIPAAFDTKLSTSWLALLRARLANPAWSLSAPLLEAGEITRAASATGTSVELMGEQRTLDGGGYSETGVQLALAMRDTPKAKLRVAFEKYATTAEGNPEGQEDIFGGSDLDVTPEARLAEVLAEAKPPPKKVSDKPPAKKPSKPKAADEPAPRQPAKQKGGKKAQPAAESVPKKSAVEPEPPRKRDKNDVVTDVVYHGGTVGEATPDVPPEGMFFTASRELAESYGPVREARLQINNPFDSGEMGLTPPSWVQDWIDFWREDDGWTDRSTGEEMTDDDVLDMIEQGTLPNYEPAGSNERWHDFLMTVREHHDSYRGLDPTEQMAGMADPPEIFVVFDQDQIQHADVTPENVAAERTERGQLGEAPTVVETAPTFAAIPEFGDQHAQLDELLSMSAGRGGAPEIATALEEAAVAYNTGVEVPTTEAAMFLDAMQAGPMALEDLVGDLMDIPVEGLVRDQLAAEEDADVDRVDDVELPPPSEQPKTTHYKFADVAARFIELFGAEVPIRFGRTGGAEVLGYFHPRREVVRIQTRTDPGTVIHEVGHAIAKRAWGRPTTREEWAAIGLNEQMMDELRAMGQKIYKEEPHNGWENEGFSEFMRHEILNDGAGSRMAPAFGAWFHGQLTPKVRQAFKAWQSEAADLKDVMRDPVQAIKAQQMTRRQVRARRRKGRLREWWRRAKTELWSAGITLREAAGDLGVKGTSKDPYDLYTALSQTAGGRAEQMVVYGMVDSRGVQVGPSLYDAVADIEADGLLGDFEVYRHARITVAEHTHAQENNRKPRETGISLKDAMKALATFETNGMAREFAPAHDRVLAWYDGLLSYIGSTSAGNRYAVEQIRANSPGDYMPLMRFIEPGNRPGSQEGATPGQALKRRKGSDRPVLKEFENVMATTRRMLNQAHQAWVVDKIVQLSNVEGSARWVEPIPVPQTVAWKGQAGEVVNKLMDLAELGAEERRKIMHVLATQRAVEEGMPVPEYSPEDFNPDIDPLPAGEEDAVTAFLSQTVTLYRPPTRDSTADPVLAVRNETGRTSFYYVNPAMLDFVRSFSRYQSQTVVGKAMSALTAFFRFSTTGASASFNLATNTVRDLQSFLFLSKDKNVVPFQAMREYVRVMHSEIPGYTYGLLSGAALGALPFIGAPLVAVVGALGAAGVGATVGSTVQVALERWGKKMEGTLTQVARKQGLHYTGFLGGDISPEAAATRKLLTRGQFAAIRELHPNDSQARLLARKIGGLAAIAMDVALEAVQVTERGPRMAALSQTAKDMGLDLESGESVTEGQMVKLMNAYKQATVDFTDAGAAVRVANRVAMPYLSASIGGPRQTIRKVIDDPVTASARLGLGFASLALGSFMLFRDEEWWKNLTPAERLRYAHVPVSIDGERELVKIPMPQEIWASIMGGVLFLEAVTEQDPELGEDAFQAMASALSPVAFPVPNVTGFTTILELCTNRDTYFDRPIETRGMQGLNPEDRYNDYTTELAKFLGKTLGWSPAKIDHAIRDVGGRSVSGAIRNVEALLAGESGGARQRSEQYGYGILLNRGGLQGTMNTYPGEKLYDLGQRLSLKDADWPKDRRGRTITPEPIASRRRLVGIATDIYGDISDDYRALDPADRSQRDARQKLVLFAGKVAKEALRIAGPDDGDPIPRATLNWWARQRDRKTWRQVLIPGS